MTELITLTRQLLTDDAVTFEGRFFTVHDAKLVARSEQRPAPPFWIGASTSAGARRAARLGDTWTMSAHASVAEILPELEAYRGERSKLGLGIPDERPISRMVYLSPDAQQARDEVLPLLAARHRTKANRFGDDDTAQQSDAELARGRWIIGDPDECIAQIQHIRDELAVNHMIFTMPWAGSSQEERLRTIDLLGRHVLPSFR